MIEDIKSLINDFVAILDEKWGKIIISETQYVVVEHVDHRVVVYDTVDQKEKYSWHKYLSDQKRKLIEISSWNICPEGSVPIDAVKE